MDQLSIFYHVQSGTPYDLESLILTESQDLIVLVSYYTLNLRILVESLINLQTKKKF